MNFIGLTLESYASILKTISSKEEAHPYWYQIKETNKSVIVDKKDEPYHRKNPLYHRVSFHEIVMIGHILKNDLKENPAYLENTFEAMKIITDRKNHNVKKQPFQKRYICAIWDSVWNKWTTPFGYVKSQDIAKNLIEFFNEKLNENIVIPSITPLPQKKITKEEIKDSKNEKIKVFNSVSNPIEERTLPNTINNSNTPKDNYEALYSNIQVRSISRKSIANKYLQTLNNNSTPPLIKQNSSGKLPTLQTYKEKKGLQLDEKQKSIIFTQIKTFESPLNSNLALSAKSSAFMGSLYFLMMPSNEIDFKDELCKRFIIDGFAFLSKDLQGNLVDWLLTLDFDPELTKECFSTLLNRRMEKGEIKYEGAIKLVLNAKKKDDTFYFCCDTIPLIFLATLCVDSRAVTLTQLDEQLTQLFEEVVNDVRFDFRNFLTIVQTFKEEGHQPKIINQRFDALLKRYAKEPEWKETLAEKNDEYKVLHGFLNRFS